MNPMTVSEMVNEAKKQIENLTPEQVKLELCNNNDVTLIDIRENDELYAGVITNSVHASRGLLEFYADPTHPFFKPEFQKKSRIILHCTSGGRSALAAVALKRMGYNNIANMDGGIKAWKDAGMSVTFNHFSF